MAELQRQASRWRSEVRHYGPHLLALIMVATVLLVRWWRYLASPVALFDEAIYLAAFRAAAAGVSPYTIDGFYYLPSFALFGSRLLNLLGETWLTALLRAVSVIGLSFTVWCSLLWWPSSVVIRLTVALLYVAAAPAVGLGIRTGNLSFAVIGAVLAALAVWPRRPIVAGTLLGMSTVVKPLAPLVTLALLAHRPRRGDRRHLLAGALGGGIFLVAAWPPASLMEMASQSIASVSFGRSFSMHRLLALIGIPMEPLVVVAIIGVAVVVLARLRPMSRAEVLSFGTVAAIAATPLIWTHSLLLVLPVQVMALARAWQRYSGGRRSTLDEQRPSAGGRWYELLLVMLGVAAIQLAEGAGAVDRHAEGVQLVVLVVPYFSPIALAAYLFATGGISSVPDRERL